MRIVFLADRSLIHTVRFTDYFNAKGHDVHLITFEDGYEVKAEVHTLPPGPGPTLFSYLTKRKALQQLLERINPDLVDAQQVSSYGNLMASLNWHPWVATALGSDVLIVPNKGWFSRKRILWALHKADMVTSMSPYMTQVLLSFGIPSETIQQSCFGIDPIVFNSINRTEHMAGTTWKLVCTRHLEPIYDHETILRAARILVAQGLDFHLTLIGKGKLLGYLQQMTSELEMQDYITYTGALPQLGIADALRTNDIFVTASHSDGANISLLEAMACGTFPVVSDIPANQQWGEDGIHQLRFPKGDSEALARQIVFATNHLELLRSAQEGNYHTVTTKGTVEMNMGKLEKAFVNLARSAQENRNTR